jgi:PAS domain S-box-containing protein
VNYSKKSKKELIKEIEILKKKNEDVSEKNYKDLFDKSPNMLYIQSEKGEFLDINRTALLKYGYKKEEVIGKTPEFLSAPKKNKIAIIKEKLALAKKGKIQTFEFWGIKKDGEIFPKIVTVRKCIHYGKEVLLATARDITKEKIIDTHLKENEEKYKTVFTKNLAGVFITNNNLIVDCNNSFAKIFGYKSRVELIGKSAIDLYFSKKDRDKYLVELKKKGYLSNYRNRQRNKEGKEIWILTNVALKEKNKLEGTLIDITEQVRVEKLLKENEKNFKSLTENSPYGIFVHIKGKILYANIKAKQVLGLKNNDKINIFDLILPENRKEAENRSKRAFNGEDVPFKEFKVKVPKTKRFIYIEIKPVLFEYHGEKAIQVVFKDITAEKELSREKLKTRIAEESNKILQNEIIERSKIEKKLIENQKYTKNIINSSLDIICASNNDGKIIEFNSAAEQAFGYNKKEIINKGVNIIYATKEEYVKVGKQLKKEGVFVGEVLNKKKNGETFTSFLSASVLNRENGTTNGTMGVSRDITQLKIVEQQLIESEEKYRDLFESATHIIQSVDMDGNILYINKAWKNTLGYTEEEIINKNIFDFIHPDSKSKCLNLFQEITKRAERKKNKISFELKTKKGGKITVEGNVSLKYKEGKPNSTRAILRDVTGEVWDKLLHSVYNNVAKIITEKENPEEIYEEIRRELGKVINTDVFAISYIEEKDTIRFPYYYDVTRGGKIKAKSRKKANGINEYLIKLGKSKILTGGEWERIVKKGKYNNYGPKAEVFIGVPLKIKNKVIGIVSVQSYFKNSNLNEKALYVLEFISGALALTVQRKQDESVIFKQSSRLKSIIENSTHLFWTYHKDKGVTSSNKNFIKYIEDSYAKKVEIKEDRSDKLRFAPKENHVFWNNKYNNALNGNPQYFISKRKNIKGKEVVKEVFLNPIYDDKGGIIEISGIAHDITEKTLSEQNLKKSLHEKEILLKEVHHRVKNNLQVISSILSLQASYVKDENTLNILKESKNRIKTMAFIHERLYQTNDFSEINFSDYIVSLSKNLVHSYGIYDNLIDLNLSVDEISLNLDLSIPCGLIVNELISNSLKYAFSKTNKGAIYIGLFENEKGINLIVQDNGSGLPEGIKYRNTDSLGLQLVMTLVEQIDGKIELDNTNGAKYIIIFKKE